MRVLWITPGFAAHEQDYNCIPTLQMLAQALTVQGIDLQILTLGYPFHNKPYRWHNIPVVSGYGFNRRWVRWWNWYRVWRYALAAHREKKFDLIHSFWLGPSWLIGQQLHKKWKTPHFTTLMGQDVLPQNKYLHLLKAHHSPSLVSLSAYHDSILKQTTGWSANHIIPWGIDATEIPTSLPQERPIDILGCGSFIPLKNWALWLQIVGDIALTSPHLRVELIGDGIDKAIIEGLIRQSGLEHIVRLRGHIPRAQVLTAMSHSKVYLHTSLFESFGFVLTEAAMNGCKVVSTPVGIAPAMTTYIGNTREILVKMVADALEEPLAESPFIPFTMEKTMAEYMALYGR